jgi:hypothetical protein
MGGEVAMDHPSGRGYAAVTVSASTGVMSLSGKLADGTVLSGTASPDEEGGYRVFLKPYGTRLNSYVSGVLKLEAHPDAGFEGLYYVPEGKGQFAWAKAALVGSSRLDVGYRRGFGPLELGVTLDPWLPVVRGSGTVAGVNLMRRLGLSADGSGKAVIGVELGGGSLDLGASAASLPRTLTLDGNGLLTVSTLGNPSKWSMSVLGTTGVFTGSFTLTDALDGQTQVISRRVNVGGVLRQGQSGSLGLGGGYFLMPSLNGATAEQVSGEVRLSRPAR